MRFPSSNLDKDQYFEDLNSLLLDKDCILFIDTNILASLYKIYASARSEFFDWADPLIAEGRIKTPVWTLNEYTKRFIKNKTSDYFSPLNKLSTIQKEFAEIKKFLQMNVDTTSLRNTLYKSEDEYQNDLNIISEKLDKIKVATKSKDLNYILNIHTEIESRFSKTVLDSNVYEILEGVGQHGANRYMSELPPGFKDDVKDLNSFGDLIIWEEIVGYCQRQAIKKAIILTNDNKTDWMYAPQKLTIGGKTTSNKAPEFKIADTRLVYEFKIKTGSEQLLIINFESLTQSLINTKTFKFYELAKALQLVNYELLRSPVNEDTESTSEDDISTLEDELIVTIQSDTHDRAVSEFSLSALADSTYRPEIQGGGAEIITELKSYSWYQQNPAINKLLKFLSLDLEINQENKDLLFVIGRNVYQAACGGAYAAIEFLQGLPVEHEELGREKINLMICGMFYEVYFDSKATLRNRFKVGFLESLFNLQQIVALKGAVEFINSQLIPYKENLIVLPTIKPQPAIFNVTYNPVPEDMGFWELYPIKSVKYNDFEILEQTSQPDYENGSSFSGGVDAFRSLLRKVYAIPNNQIELVFQPEFPQLKELGIDSKYCLKKQNMNWIYQSNI